MKCRESIEDSFDVCWNCGTSKDGEEDPSFKKEPDSLTATNAPAEGPRQSTAPSTADVVESAIQSSEERAIRSDVVDSRCPHCGGADLIRAVKLSQSAEAGSVGLQYRSLLVLVGTETVYADLCRKCGSIVRLYVQETERNWITG
jgi:hypothetical protein